MASGLERAREGRWGFARGPGYGRLLKKRLSATASLILSPAFAMKADIHPNYQDAEIRCACGNVIHTRSVKKVVVVGICNACHPFYTGQQKFVDTAGRVDKFRKKYAGKNAAAR